MTAQLAHGDCREVLKTVPDASIDAIVTDPPAGISFMSKEWDHDKGGRDAWVAWLTEVLRECLRVAKPGAHAVVWALPRTSGWTHRALEDAGWEVRDCVTALGGQGFPKSHNLPGGLGTALKPGAEFWYLARKPIIGTVSANVAQRGTGALNIAATRIGGGEREKIVSNRSNGNITYGDGLHGSLADGTTTLGRWPANVILDEEAAAMLDAAVGERQSGGGHRGQRQHGNAVLGKGLGYSENSQAEPSVGGPSRFFLTVTPDLPIDSGDELRFKYCAKASRAERNAGIEGMPEQRRVSLNTDTMRTRQCTVCGTKAKAPGPNGRYPNCEHDDWVYVEQQTDRHKGGMSNHHPTVKPIALMRWLVRLITPPGGTVLDPFAGSGTTGIACVLESVDFLGIEQDADYIAIAEKRIAHWTPDPNVLKQGSLL